MRKRWVMSAETGGGGASETALSPDAPQQMPPAAATADMPATAAPVSISLPGQDAAPEAWGEVWSALGRPETPDQYDLGGFTPPAGLPWSTDGQSAMLTEMHKAGLSSQQAQGLLQAYAGMQQQQWQAYEERAGQVVKDAETSLRKEWGQSFDGNMDAAKRAAREYFGADFGAMKDLRLQDGSYLLDNPALIRAMARIGQTMAEDGALAGVAGGGAGGRAETPEAAQAEITRRRSAMAKDANHPYWNKSDPGHAAAHAELERLYGVVNRGRKP